jgi:hypothetical protein
MSNANLVKTSLSGAIATQQNPRPRRRLLLQVIGRRSHVRAMTLDLTDDEAALLLKELNGLIDGDR